jgi:thiol-disulfide isomerase/thioredoxin
MQSLIKSSLFTLSVIFFVSQISLKGQGYEIGVRIKGVSDTTIILGHYLNKPIYPDDTIRLDANGKGVFKGKKALPEGLYVVFLPSSKYFELIIGKDQVFSFETDTTDFVDNFKAQSSLEYEVFSDFQRFMVSKRAEIEKYRSILTNNKNKKEKEAAKNSIKNLDNERKNKIKKLIGEHPELFVSTFLKTTIEIEVPDPPKDDKGKIDSTWQYKYYRSHYFDNFDLSDARLLRTPFYEERVMYFLEKEVPQIPDTLIEEIDKLINKTRSDSSLFRFMLITLFNYYGKSNIMGFDAVQVHLADKYYVSDAWWSDKKFIDDLKERVKILKPLLLGKVAPDIQLRFVPAEHFKAALADTGLKKYPHAGSFFNLQQVEADYIVLLFWEATCGHCKKSVPQMYQIYKDSLESIGVKVIAISTLFGEDGKVEWVDFVNEHKIYDWINAWNPYDYKYKIVYDIKSTPQIFILNKNKEIIGKRIGPENVTDLIRAYKKLNPY